MLGLLIQILSFIILLYVILSFFMRPDHDVMRFLSKIVGPNIESDSTSGATFDGVGFQPGDFDVDRERFRKCINSYFVSIWAIIEKVINNRFRSLE